MTRPNNLFHPTIKTLEDVRQWITALDAAGKLSHPDDDPRDTIDFGTRERTWTDLEADHIEAAWNQVFTVCNGTNLDPYKVCLDLLRGGEEAEPKYTIEATPLVDAGGVVDTPGMFTHVFRTPRTDFFRFRPAAQWLSDVLEFSPFDAAIEDVDGSTVTVTGTEEVLRFVCVLLNQHAAQSPDDPTPEKEAERLEETLRRAKAAVGVPRCSCGERRWHVDTDVIVRSAIVVGDHRDVFFDAVDHEVELAPTAIADISCQACSLPAPVSAREAIIEEAVAAASKENWKIMTDYRQF